MIKNKVILPGNITVHLFFFQASLQKLNLYKNVVVRIQFPDRIILQGIFTPTNTIEDVTDFIKEHLRNPTKKFHTCKKLLYIEILPNSHTTLNLIAFLSSLLPKFPSTAKDLTPMYTLNYIPDSEFNHKGFPIHDHFHILTWKISPVNSNLDSSIDNIT